MKFLGVSAEPGALRRDMVTVGRYADDTPVQLPVIVTQGRVDGPTGYVQAGIHGDEATAIDVCRRVVAALDPAELRGTVVVVPIGNVPAYLTRSRSYLHEERGPIDMNRIFPGNPHGLLTERIAAAIVDGFINHVDYAIDLHAGLAGCIMHPCVYVSGRRGDPVRDGQDRIADAMAYGLTCVQDGQLEFGHTNLARSFASVAASMGVPAVVAEMGESGRVTERFVDLGVGGVLRALAAMGNLPERLEQVEQSIRFGTIAQVHAERGGLIEHRRQLGEKVSAGDELVAVFDPYTGNEEVAVAPVDGIVYRQMVYGGCGTGAELVWLAADFLDD